jgi:transcriptional regulator with XRE-family HTH domain
MMPSKWTELKNERARKPAVQAGYGRARNAYRLAERVRLLREASGMSQLELAQRMGTTQSAIARLEAGGTYPNFQTLERVGGALRAELVVEFREAASAPPASLATVVATRVRRVVRARSRAFGKGSIGTRAKAKKVAKKR